MTLRTQEGEAGTLRNRYKQVKPRAWAETTSGVSKDRGLDMAEGVSVTTGGDSGA